MNSRFDHHLLAADIEALYGLSTRVDHRLHDSGLVSWIDPARRASLQILEQLAALRAELDHIAVAAGLDAMRSPYFPVRSMKPTTETKAAARKKKKGIRE
ncbi:hypothetical protein [Pseudoxanthomonas daejeonensis]|uniref:hypothetical protein n=1 Tax=Pseudoxanthomonas daejeonensis TaxID=266062 RepID=UPI001391E48A|nr:hypothetical protein [Pseudoxanthomonas daejeonensis]